MWGERNKPGNQGECMLPQDERSVKYRVCASNAHVEGEADHLIESLNIHFQIRHIENTLCPMALRGAAILTSIHR
jgi:hypothetical protein